MAGKIIDCYTTDGYIITNEFARSPRDNDILRDINNKNRYRLHNGEAQIYKVKVKGNAIKEYNADFTGVQYYFFTTKKEKEQFLKSQKGGY